MKEMQHRLDNETGTAEGDHKKAKGEKAANKGLKKGHGRRNAGKQSC